MTWKTYVMALVLFVTFWIGWTTLDIIKTRKIVEVHAPRINAGEVLRATKINSIGSDCIERAERLEELRNRRAISSKAYAEEMDRFAQECEELQGVSPSTTTSSAHTNSGPTVSTSTAPYAHGPAETFKATYLGDNKWEVQLNARTEWQRTGIYVNHGDTVEFFPDLTKQACSPPDPCMGPAGRRGYPNMYPTQNQGNLQYAVSDADFHSLVARFDDCPPFQVGGENLVATAPPGRTEIRMMTNFRTFYLPEASGGHKVIIKINTVH